jgi:hypothetical protein
MSAVMTWRCLAELAQGVLVPCPPAKEATVGESDRVVLLDNKQVTVWVYPARGIVHHLMKAYCHGAEFREALSKGAEAMATHKGTKWLSDDRANGALPADDEQWAISTWFPASKAAGWKHWAIVQPQKLIGQMNMERFRKMYADLGINAQMFGDPDLAFSWIDAQ